MTPRVQIVALWCTTRGMPLAAVLFDLDGTLVDSERMYAEAMTCALRRGLGIEATSADRNYIVGRSWEAIAAHLRVVYGEQMSWSRDELIDATFAEHKTLSAQRPVAILPGAHAAIERFADVRRAIVTGSSRKEAVAALVALAKADAFDAVFACEDYPRSKPAPDGYLAAMNALGVLSSHCLVIEDSTAGIASGRAAGAAVVGVRAGNFIGADQSVAHRVVDTLDDVTLALAHELMS